MGMDEDVATTVLSVFTGLVIGTAAETMMPSANAGASAAELMFETAVQTAILVVMFRVLVNFDDLRASGGIPFGLAVAAAHQVLEPLLQKYSLDGTIIEDYRTDEQCEGPTEIVLRGSCVRHVKRLYD